MELQVLLSAEGYFGVFFFFHSTEEYSTCGVIAARAWTI